MYKGNGNQRVFPLPEGADGSAVALSSGGIGRWLQEGEAYVVRDGNVVFAIAPPRGTHIGIGSRDTDAAKALPVNPSLIVLRPDGTMEEVSEDPAVLLAEAREQLREAKAMLKAAVSAQEAVRIIADEQRRIGEATFTGRLAKYEGLVEESVGRAALLARDDVKDSLKSNLLEMRNKHKATIEAHAAVVDLLRGAKGELRALVDEAAERLERKCEPLLGALAEMRSLAAKAQESSEAAKSAALSAGAESAKIFGDRTEVVLEELRSLKSTVSNEIKSAIEGAKATMNAEIEQARSLRDTASRAARRCEEIERRAELR